MVRILLGYILLCCMAMAGCTDSANQKNLEPRTITPQPATENRVPGQYIVTLREGGSTKTLNKVFDEYGIKSIKDLSKGRFLIALERDPGPEEISKRADTSSEIEHAQPNYIYRTMPQVKEKTQPTR